MWVKLEMSPANRKCASTALTATKQTKETQTRDIND